MPIVNLGALAARGFKFRGPGDHALPGAASVRDEAEAARSIAAVDLVGSEGDDELIGSEENDVIQGLGGQDYIYGLGGDDWLEGGEGGDDIVGGLGDDLLYGGEGVDWLFETNGADDQLYGEGGDDELHYSAALSDELVTGLLDGGDGDDLLSFGAYGFQDRARLLGGDGNDTIQSRTGGQVEIDAGAGADFVLIDNLGTLYDIVLGSGSDILYLHGITHLEQGTAGIGVSDFTPGDAGDALALTQYLTLVADGWNKSANPFASGHLELIQRGADAVIRFDEDGSAGLHDAFVDLLVLENVAAGSLTVRNIGFAPDGSATLGLTVTGTDARDVLTGAGGDDLLLGLDEDDRLLGGAGNDRIEGGDGHDIMTGEVGDDLLFGGAGHDGLYDSLHGSDQLFGEAGNDGLTVERQWTPAPAGTILLDGGGDDDSLTYIGGVGRTDTVTLLGGTGDDLIRAYGGGAITIDGGDGAEIIAIDLTAASYSITLGSDAGHSDIVRLDYLALSESVTAFTILDFTPGNGGDLLDYNVFLLGVLSGWDGIANPFATGHLQLAQGGADAVILIDRDGGGNSFALLGWLNNVDAAQLTALNLDFQPGEIAVAIPGTAGADMVDGRGSAGLLIGRAGNDTYLVDNAGDRAIEAAGGGTDIVYASVSYSLNDGSEVENLSTIDWASTAALNLTGNSLANQLFGNAGANRLDGKGGADTMTGREGNDTYLVDNAGDRVFEYAGGGADAVYASVSYTLTANSDVETLATISFEATNTINLTGNGLANYMIGNDGANQLDGKAGADVMIGRAGNDKYFVDNAGDKTFESAGGGTDLVYASVSFALTDAQEVESLSTVTWELTNAIDLTGNGLANQLFGNAGANRLDGRGGNDVLHGKGGADIFAFTTVLGANNVDAIHGFSAADDTIMLENNGVFVGLSGGALNPNAFVIGTAAQDAGDRIVYDQPTGRLFFDADGSGSGAQVQFALLNGAPIISASDFTVI